MCMVCLAMPWQVHDYIEYFCGEAAVSSALHEAPGGGTQCLQNHRCKDFDAGRLYWHQDGHRPGQGLQQL